MKHKYYDVIVAWAEGKEIEFKNKYGNVWYSFLPCSFTSPLLPLSFNSPQFNSNKLEWRIKLNNK